MSPGGELYEVCIAGELELPPGVMEAWRALLLDASLYSDWPFAFDELQTEDPVSIGAWLDDCAYERGGRRTFLDVSTTDTQLRITGLVDAADYERWRRQLATMFRLAARVGGRGALTFVTAPDEETSFGWRVVVEPEVSTMRALDEPEIATAHASPALRQILSRQAA